MITGDPDKGPDRQAAPPYSAKAACLSGKSGFSAR